MAADFARDSQSGAESSRSRSPGARGHTAEAERPGETSRAQAQAIWNDARNGVRSALNEKQRSTAADIHEFAGALRSAARNIDQHSPVVRVAEQAAESLERLSGKLRSKDLDGLVHDVQVFARSQPAVFLGMAVAAGFLAARFVKSSSPDTDSRDDHPTAFSPAGSQPDRDATTETALTFPYDPRRK